jgi:hypothetical protein
MLPIGLFAFAFSAIIGCVWWACAEDQNQT